MKITMLRTEKGSVDGIQVQTYEKGKSYDMPEKLAKVFVHTLKIAEFTQEEKTQMIPQEEIKDAKKAPENKSADKKDKKEGREE